MTGDTKLRRAKNGCLLLPIACAATSGEEDKGSDRNGVEDH